MERSGVGTVLVRGDPLLIDLQSAKLAALALRQQLPAIYPWPSIPAVGGLMVYNTSIRDLHRRSAWYVHRILKGARPQDLPVEQPRTFELVVNLKTAKAIGLTIPPSILLRADQVIE
jgi:putative ABC transport system substrate-binding protein